MQPWFACAPAHARQHMRACHQCISRRGFQCHMAIPVAINSTFQNITGQHLDHANFTRPRASGGHWVKIATLVKFKGRKNLGAE